MCRRPVASGMERVATQRDHNPPIGATLGIEAAAVVKLGRDIGERTIIASLHPGTFPVLLNAVPTYAIVA